jgi:oxygen-dependent protoporphyrinogen oxidase
MNGASGQRGRSHVLVIGGGIAGLAAAIRLRSLDDECRVTIADCAQTLGGKIAREIVEGCVIDGGADVCIGDKLRATHLFDSLSLAEHVIRVNPNALPTLERRGETLTPMATTFEGELLTFRGGMRELVDIAATALSNVDVSLDTEIASLNFDDGVWSAITTTGDDHAADAVIVATPATASANLLELVAPAEATQLAKLEYPATTTITMAWRKQDVPHELNGTGYLVVNAESPFSACTWISSKNPSHASAGLVTLRGYVRGADGDASALMLDEVKGVLGIATPPLFTRVYEWKAGIPLYTEAHRANVAALGEKLDASPGLFIAGSTFHGIGVPDCIASGERAADRVIAYLQETQTKRTA